MGQKLVGIDLANPDLQLQPSGQATPVERFRVAPPIFGAQDATVGFESMAAAAVIAEHRAPTPVNARQVRDSSYAIGKFAKTDAFDDWAIRPEPRWSRARLSNAWGYGCSRGTRLAVLNLLPNAVPRTGPLPSAPPQPGKGT